VGGRGKKEDTRKNRKTQCLKVIVFFRQRCSGGLKRENKESELDSAAGRTIE